MMAEILLFTSFLTISGAYQFIYILIFLNVKNIVATKRKKVTSKEKKCTVTKQQQKDMKNIILENISSFKPVKIRMFREI